MASSKRTRSDFHGILRHPMCLVSYLLRNLRPITTTHRDSDAGQTVWYTTFVVQLSLFRFAATSKHDFGCAAGSVERCRHGCSTAERPAEQNRLHSQPNLTGLRSSDASFGVALGLLSATTSGLPRPTVTLFSSRLAAALFTARNVARSSLEARAGCASRHTEHFTE